MKNQILLSRRKIPAPGFLDLCCVPFRTLKNERIIAQKICPAPGFLEFFVSLLSKSAGYPKTFREKNYLPGKESSVFLALKIEDSLSEKYVRIKIAYVNIDFCWVAYEEP